MNQNSTHEEMHSPPSSGRDGVLEQLLDSEEAAALLKIHPKTLQKLARSGEITGIQIGRLWRFRASALNRWLERMTIYRIPSWRMNIENISELMYSQSRRSVPFKQGGSLFKRTTYQEGSWKLEERRRGPHVWVYRWWETDATGKRVYRKYQVGDQLQYPSESAARAVLDALRLTVNSQSQRNGVTRMTVQSLWDHYKAEELPSKEFSTQDAYIQYATKWILPRWGRVQLPKIKTVDVERWLR